MKRCGGCWRQCELTDNAENHFGPFRDSNSGLPRDTSFQTLSTLTGSNPSAEIGSAYRPLDYIPNLTSCPDFADQWHGKSGLHGTPVGGTTLLHLAIDFDEQEIFDLLLAHGADVNARASVDADGYGGHTPLFNCIVSDAFLCGRQRGAVMARTLLTCGASPDLRTSLRKFIDWRAEPGWHEARDVTAAEWGSGFPEPDWVNVEALKILGHR